jgi:hypothetical protein
MHANLTATTKIRRHGRTIIENITTTTTNTNVATVSHNPLGKQVG